MDIVVPLKHCRCISLEMNCQPFLKSQDIKRSFKLQNLCKNDINVLVGSEMLFFPLDHNNVITKLGFDWWICIDGIIDGGNG